MGGSCSIDGELADSCVGEDSTDHGGILDILKLPVLLGIGVGETEVLDDKGGCIRERESFVHCLSSDS